MRKVESAFGHTDNFTGVVGRNGKVEGSGIGEADIFGSENNEATGDEAGVFATFEHFGEPVESGVGVGAADTFNESGNGVVVLVFVAVVGDLAFLRKLLEVRGGDFGTGVEAESEGFEGIEGAAEITVAELGDFKKNIGRGGNARRGEAAVGVG